MQSKAIWMALGALLLSLPGAAQQVKAHTEFRVKLTGPLSTQANHKGDRLAAQVVAPQAFAGDTLEGEITDINGKGVLHHKAVLRIIFKRLHTKRAAVAVIADLKLITNTKGAKNSDEAGAGIAFDSESRSGGAEIVVQMWTPEKSISFAPGTTLLLDVSPVDSGAGIVTKAH